MELQDELVAIDVEFVGKLCILPIAGRFAGSQPLSS
jgi:hypothetical protein